MTKIKLDTKDRAIVQALEKNGRALIKDISKKTGIPRDSVNYRLKKMLSEGVIKGFAPICDSDKIGHPVYSWMCIQIQQYDEETENRFKAFLVEHPNITYISQVTGHYHYIISILTKNIKELDKIIKKMLSEFPNFVKSYNTSLLIEESQYDSYYKLIAKD